MELPKNITQIGEVNKDCKVYVEDYVVSYMKQLNQSAQDKGMAVALYGKRQAEDGVSYHFLYGACKLDFLQREVRHLSQAQLMEIEKLRKRYFPDLEFVGYRILNGEMIEGIHLCEQEICRYIGGYARFYEKNDGMLAYMLDARAAVEPEHVAQTKYEEVKKRQEERRLESGRVAGNRETSDKDGAEPLTWHKHEGAASANLKNMRLAAVGAFALLCLIGIGTFREDELAGNSQSSSELAVSGTVEPGAKQKDTLMMEDKLEEALLAENQSAESEADREIPQSFETESVVEESVEAESAEAESSQQEVSKSESSVATTAEAEQAVFESNETTQVSQDARTAVAYIIQPGDTLIGICFRQYGDDTRMADVCSINDISDPDDIKEGQVIMLPQ